MPVEIRVPPLGESLVDAVVGQWLKGEGDTVSRGETVVELETDKVNLDVTAPEDGVLAKIDRSEGDVVKVGDLLGTVSDRSATDANGSTAPVAEQVIELERPAEQPAAAPAAEVPAAASSASVASAQPEQATTPTPTAGDNGAGRAAPAVRLLAEEHRVDLASIPGTGPGGRVTREDVLAAASAASRPPAQPVSTPAPQPVAAAAVQVPSALPPTPAAAPTPPPAASAAPVAAPATATPRAADPREERVRMSRRRQTIAARLVEAQHTAAMLTTFNEVDMTAIMELRAQRKAAFTERHGIGLGFMSFFTKAVVGALKAFPQVNAEIQGDEMVLKRYYDIGIAVGAEEGLVVPVVRDADRKSFAEIEKEIAALAQKVREGTLALSELQGGTFTITNGGIFGSLLSTPILNYPQSGILGMHTIQQRPVAKNGEVAIRPMMYVALSYDHRIVDGREAVQFLVRVKELAEDPTTLLLEG
jgi:2-oxoglutarate dehydrogenase E2 component (dihydrolipoamide succinyltransferase)